VATSVRPGHNGQQLTTTDTDYDLSRRRVLIDRQIDVRCSPFQLLISQLHLPTIHSFSVIFGR